ncbi:MBL fold metallo-hydrolase [Rubeoparvulum massiliense]|uniref:MBL fold metallo-hydrolase n=1 Tax=Rubeoparvulum massiliense TaxID=1631346 RepID=UPI00065E4FFB|nr:MBL fold metallo-hydrolase [Rubeoparvulum massiliense]
MKYSILASGSSGNCTYVETDHAKILIDAGLSGKQLEELADEAHIDLKEVQGIFITHEHSDHIKGAGILARRYRVPVYANAKTWLAMEKQLGKLEDWQRIETSLHDYVEIADLRIENFPISHDAACPVGYSLYCGNEKLSIATDMGYVNTKTIDQLQGSHVLIMESNHDPQMLRMSRYPWRVIQRILSDTGHLSNEDAGEALGQIITTETKEVYLAHLSQDANLHELAQLTVRNILSEQGLAPDQAFQLLDAYPDRATPLRTLALSAEQLHHLSLG